MKLFSKIRINYTKGKLRQVRIFDIPVWQYEKSELTNNKLKLSFPLFNKSPKSDLVFYLKFNSANFHYNIASLEHWINIVNAMGGDYYIICDNKNLERQILSQLKFDNSNIKFIQSDNTISSKLIKAIAIPFWRKAARAHLTTFYHAQKIGLNSFWNIDADDTMFFDEASNVAAALKIVQKYAVENNINCFSLDMHSSYFNGILWNFGVTFVYDTGACIKAIKEIDGRMKQETPYCGADNYFRHLKNKNLLNCKTYNINNCYFVHWGQWGIIYILKTLQICKNNKLIYPFMAQMALNSDIGVIDTAPGIINFDTCITEESSRKFLDDILLKERRRIYNRFWRNNEISAKN